MSLSASPIMCLPPLCPKTKEEGEEQGEDEDGYRDDGEDEEEDEEEEEEEDEECCSSDHPFTTTYLIHLSPE